MAVGTGAEIVVGGNKVAVRVVKLQRNVETGNAIKVKIVACAGRQIDGKPITIARRVDGIVLAVAKRQRRRGRSAGRNRVHRRRHLGRQAQGIAAHVGIGRRVLEGLRGYIVGAARLDVIGQQRIVVRPAVVVEGDLGPGTVDQLEIGILKGGITRAREIERVDEARLQRDGEPVLVADGVDHRTDRLSFAERCRRGCIAGNRIDGNGCGRAVIDVVDTGRTRVTGGTDVAGGWVVHVKCPRHRRTTGLRTRRERFFERLRTEGPLPVVQQLVGHSVQNQPGHVYPLT